MDTYIKWERAYRLSKDDGDSNKGINGKGKVKAKGKNKNGRKRDNRWPIKVFVLTFVIACAFSFFSEATVRRMDNLVLAILILLIIIAIGIVFDIIGIAVASASEVPFVSMASKKIRGAKEAILLIKKADQVSNFCNDVVGDICGIVSGAAGGVLIMKIMWADFTSLEESLLSIIISSLIAAVTVAGKALGKSFAISNCDKVVYYTAYFLSLLNEKKESKNRKNNSKGKAVVKAREN